MDIIIKAEPRAELPIELVGVKYLIAPPKAVISLQMAVKANESSEDPAKMMEALGDWITAAFNEKDAEAVIARLNDADDLLDVQHIAKLMEAVIEADTGAPPT